MKLDLEIRKTLKAQERVFELDVRFQSEKNLIVIFGQSGAGKSVTIQMIAGLMAADQGRIVLNGRALFDSDAHVNLPARKRNIGYVFQDYALFPHLNVAQNVGFAIESLCGPEMERHYMIRSGIFLRSSNCRTSAAAIRGNFPVVNGNVWRSPERLSVSRTSCCSMNPSRRSIRCCGIELAASYSEFRKDSVCRWSSSPMTPPTSSSSPRISLSLITAA